MSLMRKFIRGLTTGTIIGTISGMLLFPEMTRSTKKKIGKSKKIIKDLAEGLYLGIKRLV